MLSAWDFPQSLNLGGVEYKIRSDYRDIINLLIALADPDMKGDSREETAYIKGMLILEILYEDYTQIPNEHLQEAIDKAVQFIDMCADEDSKNRNHIRIMDWEQDANLIIPAVNRVIGKEIRAERYIHWWTFLSAYLEIGECSFSHILNIRTKKSKGKKLDKWEEEYIRSNPNVLLKRKYTEQEQKDIDEESNALADLLG